MPDAFFSGLVLLAAIIAGGIASVAGFGIGSLLTPLLSLQVETKVAVAAISIPHFLGTLLRFWLLRKAVDRHVLLSFGLTSAAGGLIGAVLHSFAGSPILTAVFGSLLIFPGAMGATGLAERLRFEGIAAWLAGAASGLFGGLVGNQGGIRSAALLGFDVPRDAFVATATAIALAVDVARMPVYLVTEAREIGKIWALVGVASAGVLIGTAVGARVLRRIPESIFRRSVSTLILILGLFMLLRIGG